MIPFLLYPQNAAQAKSFQEYAEKQGVEMMRVSQAMWEEFDDMLFAERMKARRTGKLVSEEKVRQLIKDKLAGK